MHPYATDSLERKNMVFFLALISLALAYCFHILLSKLGIQWPWWGESPSVMGIFGAIYAIFDKKLWCYKWLRGLGVVKVPDLNGRWKVQGHSSTHNEDFVGEMYIRQTWTHISIIMETKLSKSYSLTASVLTKQPYGITLVYEYKNEPKPNALPTMHAHRGTAVIHLKDKDFLEGEYYSGRDRLNYGTLNLRRVE